MNSIIKIICVLLLIASPVTGKSASLEISNEIDSYISQCFVEHNLPGLAVAVINGNDDVFIKCLGFSDIKKKIEIDETSLFELGSNSKAFTGLGILLLEQKGLLNLNDPVTKYLPGFNPKYNGENVTIRIRDLLYQTSGISPATIDLIKPGNDANSLKRTVDDVSNTELVFNPGSQFLYATVNYDILGRIIEIVTGLSFESYIVEEVLTPLQLDNTYLARDVVKPFPMTKGYKLDLFGNREYKAPIYKGNVPAGYYISNITDVAKWMNINMNPSGLVSPYNEIVLKSHMPNEEMAPQLFYPHKDSLQYGSGWMVFKSSDIISHAGNNPNYSSYIIVDKTKKIGIAVLSNVNSNCTYDISKGIYDLLSNHELSESSGDMQYTLNKICRYLVIITVVLFLLSLFRFLYIIRLVKKEKKFYNSSKKRRVLSLMFILLLFISLLLYFSNHILLNGLSWTTILVWAPFSLLKGYISIFLIIAILLSNMSLSILYAKRTNNHTI